MLLAGVSYGQQFDTLRIATYNVLNYPGGTSVARNPEFRKIMSGLQPDLLVVQEMQSAAGMADFHANVLNAVVPGVFSYVPFHDGPDTDNGLFYRNDRWEVLSASYIATALRNIAEYVVRPLSSSETLRVYSLHLKASSGSTNEQLRFAEASILRDYLNALPEGTNFLVVGDFNIYTSAESAWQKLIGSEANNTGRSIDPLNLTGTWNNPAYAQYHTQSPRVRSFGGGATGGMDDRFDIMLTSSSMTDNLLAATYKAYGNDGNHYNDSINRLPNAAVPDSIANALHAASDHLPVSARFVFPITSVPVQLAFFTGGLNATQDSVVLTWRTITETNNLGFEVQRRVNSRPEFVSVPDGFVPGQGTTQDPHDYRFAEALPISEGTIYYRLKQITFSGDVYYSDPVVVSPTTHAAESFPSGGFMLAQNYPNPFNPATNISFTVDRRTFVSIVVSDLLGREVRRLFNRTAEAGVAYTIEFNAAAGNPLPSGVYFYRLALANHARHSLPAKRMILMK